jgi:hypothetical protein
MTRLVLDKTWFLLYPIFALGSAASLGIVQVDILPFLNMGDVVLDPAGVEFTVGRLMGVGALLAVAIDRDASITDSLGVVEIWIVYVTVGLLIAPPFLPILQNTLVGGFAGTVAFIVQSIGFTAVEYMN